MSDQIIPRLNSQTGRLEYHTLSEWNRINGYDQPAIKGEVLTAAEFAQYWSEEQDESAPAYTPVHPELRVAFAAQVVRDLTTPAPQPPKPARVKETPGPGKPTPNTGFECW